MSIRNFINRTIILGGIGATGYGYYLSKQYNDIPFYKLPNKMEINSIVGSFKNSPKYNFAYCNTFFTSIPLDPELVKEYSTDEKGLIDRVITSFMNSALYRLETFNYRTNDIKIEDINRKELEAESAFYQFLPRTMENSIILRSITNLKLVRFFEILSDYILPYRFQSESFQEIYVEINPEIDPETNIISTYSADIYFSNADLYDKYHYDGKIKPLIILVIGRFYNRLLLQSGASNISAKLGKKD